MERKWCCAEFESAASASGKNGFRVVLAWDKRGLRISALEFRLPNNPPPNKSEGLSKIKFCPWCGSDLDHTYGYGQAKS